MADCSCKEIASLSFGMVEELLELRHEVIDVLELPVNGGESNIDNVIQ